MGRSFSQIYGTLGSIFGLILAAPLWFAALFGQALPTTSPQILALLEVLLIATIKGVLRSFAWLPSIVYNVGMHKVPFEIWLFHGWW